MMLVLLCTWAQHESAQNSPVSQDTTNEEEGDMVIESDPILPTELNDETFEHETQAATGATTGDWFVMFYAPWCGHWNKLKPTWNELANELKGKINVAKVNCDESQSTADRFEVRGYPTLLFFKRGKYYKYTEAERDVKSLANFALSEYHKTQQQGPVPRELTTVDFAMKVLSRFYEEVIYGFDGLFYQFDVGFLPWYIKIVITLIALFSPAIVVSLLILWWEKRYIDSKEAAPLEEFKEVQKENKPKTDKVEPGSEKVKTD